MQNDIAQAQPQRYVTFTEDGELDGCYLQIPPDEHISRLIAIEEVQVNTWANYRANDARDGLELVPLQPAAVVPAARRITCLAFRNRFTVDEKVMIELAAADNPAGALDQRTQAARLRANMADVAAATFIDLDRPDTRAGVQLLEAAGVLGAGRALEILDGEVQADERPAGL
jgi:hypothetical protein